jgi:hypothetical protein
MKIPKFPVNAKRLKALACVFGVLFSEIIARIVLDQSVSGVQFAW